MQAHGANTRKYWLVEVIENDCIVTQVGVYDELSPEPSSRQNTVTVSLLKKNEHQEDAELDHLNLKRTVLNN